MKKINIKSFGSVQYGYGHGVWGICLFDKFCYTNQFGLEIL